MKDDGEIGKNRKQEVEGRKEQTESGRETATRQEGLTKLQQVKSLKTKVSGEKPEVQCLD
jgi:hypothetical protein